MRKNYNYKCFHSQLQKLHLTLPYESSHTGLNSYDHDTTSTSHCIGAEFGPLLYFSDVDPLVTVQDGLA
jgi:hypothetical protein